MRSGVCSARSTAIGLRPSNSSTSMKSVPSCSPGIAVWGRASNAQVDAEAVNVFTLRDGYIVKWECYWSRAQAFKAAGVQE